MNIAAADPSWWADWLKFTPGWLAFGIGLWTLFDKWRARRHRLALGPDDAALRKALTALRRPFKEILAEGRRQDWINADERRGANEALRDLVWRQTDTALGLYAARVSLAWTYVGVNAPSPLGPCVEPGDETTPEGQAQAAKDQEQFLKQRMGAEQGLSAIDAALDRLNQLERRTIGRS